MNKKKIHSTEKQINQRSSRQKYIADQEILTVQHTSVSHNGYFVLFYIAKIIFETGFPLFLARHPVIFNKSVKHGVHFVGFWIAARHFVGRDILKSLGKDVGIAASASVYAVFGLVVKSVIAIPIRAFHTEKAQLYKAFTISAI